MGHKVDIVKTEYWEKGIQTEDIPWDVLSEYARVDAEMTLKLYHKQMELLSREKLHLVNLMCMDLPILAEMEWNGLKYNEEMCAQRSREIEEEIQGINQKLSEFYPDIDINFNSGDQLSAFLYGGTIEKEDRVHDGFFKTGAKAGQPKFRKVIRQHVLPRIFEPVRGSQLKKEGVFATNEDALKKIKSTKKNQWILDSLFQLAKLDTQNRRYYIGIPKINHEMNWESEYIHGQFNQVVAQTGRLSSEKPNLQNMAGDIQDILVSRFDD